jgi:hypothetical protein
MMDCHAQRAHWTKRRWQVSGGGWVPLDFSALDYDNPLALQLSELSSIDVDGNPVYVTGSHTVVLPEPPLEEFDPVSRLYSWSFVAEEQ